MVGDVGYAIPFIILGAYGLKKTQHKDWRAIALVLFFGGIWAFLFGLFFYGEMLGMHFVGGEYVAGQWEWHDSHIANDGTNVSWDWILGGQFPEWFTDCIAKVGAWDKATGAFQTDSELFGVGVGKLEDVAFLLKLSVYMGVVHLFIGLICGIANGVMQHGAKHAVLEKGGVIFTFFGMIFLCIALTNFMFSGDEITGGVNLIILVLAIVFIVLGIV